MDVKITTLSENTATIGFIGEWGLSILIETDNRFILLDAGGPHLSATRNAEILGIEFNTIDWIVLSHGHFDHTGGLKDILENRTETTDVISHPSIWDAKFSVSGHNRLHIGFPFKREQLETLGALFILSGEPVWLTENIVTSGEVPFVTDYEETDQTLYRMNNNMLIQDDFPDDLSLAVKTEKGLAIFLGCAHRGMMNIIYHFQNITGDERIYSVIGGTHLISASLLRLNKTIADLKRIGIQKLGVSHCTGFEASARLAAEFKDKFFLNSAGSRHILT
jgi:7,8-dihydropterin-6-yl-methyl-4-(beta-D-ribofuranosyl)aminobenzene 5'-phosphate synthase